MLNWTKSKEGLFILKKKQAAPQNGTAETAGRPLKAAQANGGGDGDQVLS